MTNEEDTTTTTTIADTALVAISNINTSSSIVFSNTNNTVWTGGSLQGDPTTTLTIEVPHDICQAAYDYSLGDLVMCKAEGKYKDRVGKIVDRDIKLKYDMLGTKQLTGLRFAGYYRVDFGDNQDNISYNGSQLHYGKLSSSKFSYLPRFSEEDLELTFSK